MLPDDCANRHLPSPRTNVALGARRRSVCVFDGRGSSGACWGSDWTRPSPCRAAQSPVRYAGTRWHTHGDTVKTLVSVSTARMSTTSTMEQAGDSGSIIYIKLAIRISSIMEYSPASSGLHKSPTPGSSCKAVDSWTRFLTNQHDYVTLRRGFFQRGPE